MGFPTAPRLSDLSTYAFSTQRHLLQYHGPFNEVHVIRPVTANTLLLHPSPLSVSRPWWVLPRTALALQLSPCVLNAPLRAGGRPRRPPTPLPHARRSPCTKHAAPSPCPGAMAASKATGGCPHPHPLHSEALGAWPGAVVTGGAGSGSHRVTPGAGGRDSTRLPLPRPGACLVPHLGSGACVWSRRRAWEGHGHGGMGGRTFTTLGVKGGGGGTRWP
jgi:hypothetical protein